MGVPPIWRLHRIRRTIECLLLHAWHHFYFVDSPLPRWNIKQNVPLLLVLGVTCLLTWPLLVPVLLMHIENISFSSVASMVMHLLEKLLSRIAIKVWVSGSLVSSDLSLCFIWRWSYLHRCYMHRRQHRYVQPKSETIFWSTESLPHVKRDVQKG